jgi:apolipoprotein N-acyltransferase
MKTYQLFLLSILSGLLLTFAWFPNGFTPLIFIAFVPLLIVEHTVFQNPQKYKSLVVFVCSFFTFLIWNILTTWWVKNASLGGAAMAISCNALLMSLVFALFHKTKKRIGEKYGVIIFICFWITFEFFHLRWDLSWPWLTLGNAFADTPDWIQWYEYTGAFGGSLWVLLINVLVFKNITKSGFRISIKKNIVIISLLIAPVLLSYLVKFMSANSEKKNIQVVIVQPNIDPYNDKFSGTYAEQLQTMLDLAQQKADSTTDYLIFPETALTENIWENQLTQSASIKTLQDFNKRYPKLKIIIGAATAKVYEQNEPLSSTARKFTNDDSYYDSYNTALQLDNYNPIQIYHKSKLVPGVEKMPFPFIFKYFEKFAIDLGGTAGSLGTQEERTVFTSSDKDSKAAPVVCYESIYGEYVSDYVKNGATFISIITNDGWWGDTPGYKQHLKYATLRAIETRRSIARSANTGISCFINPYGNIQQATKWWTPDVISQKIQLNDQLTFYTRYGDYIARIGMYISLLILVYSSLIRLHIIKK